MRRFLAAIALVSVSHASFGCSYDLRLFDTVEKKFLASDIVVLAEVAASTREQFQYEDGTRGTREVVEFRVKEVFLGDVEEGSKIVTSTDIGRGCSLNVLTLESVEGPIKLGKWWLLYLNSGRPYELVETPGSFPLFPDSTELEELRLLRQKHGSKRSAS
jgi:hypothetical protein